MNREGSYWAYLIGGVVSETKGGQPQMAVTFEVKKYADGEWSDIAPFKTTLYMSFSDKAWEFTERKLKALGFNNNFDAPDFDDAPKIEGVQLDCKHEDYQGKPQEKWELGNFGGGPKKIEDASVIKKLQARWNAGNGAKPTGKPVAPPRPHGKVAPGTPLTKELVGVPETDDCPI